MTMTDEKMLDDTFAQMRDGGVDPSDALMNRIMMDADTVLAQGAAPVGRLRPTWRAALADLIGGWPSIGGLVAATMAGLWIGVSPPAALTNFSQGYLGTTVQVQLFETDIYAGLDQ